MLPALALVCVGVVSLLPRPSASSPRTEYRGGLSMLLTDTATAQLASLGYGSFLASLLWVDGIFDYVDAQLGNTPSDHPVDRLWMVIALDPAWEDPYHFAGLTLEDHEGRPLPDAIRILERGVARFPNSWKLRLYLGMGMLARGDTARASIVMAGLARVEGKTPPYVRELAISYAHRTGGRAAAVQDILVGFQIVDEPIGRMGFVRKLENILDSSGVEGAKDSALAVERAFRGEDEDVMRRWGAWLARVVAATAPGSGSSRSP